MNLGYKEISGVDIKRLADQLYQVIKDEDVDLSIMTCLSMAIVLRRPRITVEQLQFASRGLTEWIELFVSELEHPTEKDRIN